MTVVETQIEGCFVIEPRIFRDSRGFFFESFNQRDFEKYIGRQIAFVQDNQSRSIKGVVRGLHYQTGIHQQAKLVRTLNGSVLDVVVDLRKESPTYGQHFTLELNDENQKQIFIPRGCAHGFSVLSEVADFFYKCDNYYNQSAEAGILFNDKFLSIDWGIPLDEIIISEKDKQLPSWDKAVSP